MDDLAQPIDRLCKAIGMMMANTSAVAIVLDHDGGRGAKIEALAIAPKDIVALANAAAILERRAAEQGASNPISVIPESLVCALFTDVRS